MRAGSIGLGAVGDTPPVFAQAAHGDLLYVAGLRSGAQAILLPSGSGITTPADLKGRRLAFGRGSSAHNFAIKALEQAGLRYDQVEPVYLGPADEGAAFARGSIDAWSIWDPYFALFENRRGVRTLMTSNELAEQNSFVLGWGPFVRANPAMTERLVDNFSASCAWVRGHRDAVVDLLAGSTGMAIDTMRRVIARVPAEFLQIWRSLLADGAVDFDGRHLAAKDAQLGFFDSVQKPYPPLWFGGSSAAGIDVAAEHVDTYLTWGEPPAQVAQKLGVVKARAAARGRTLFYGLRVHLIVRETDAEAWEAANRLISHLSDETISAAQRRLRADTDSVGQLRQMDLHGGLRDRLEVSPNRWAGVGLVRHGVGTALVGSPETVAKRLWEYQALGVQTISASGYPHLEEAYRVAELLFPVLGIGQCTFEPGRDFRAAASRIAAE